MHLMVQDVDTPTTVCDVHHKAEHRTITLPVQRSTAPRGLVDYQGPHCTPPAVMAAALHAAGSIAGWSAPASSCACFCKPATLRCSRARCDTRPEGFHRPRHTTFLQHTYGGLA